MEATGPRSEPLSICTLGDLNLDVIVRPVAPLRADADTPASIRFRAGGQAANVAAWTAALGARSRLICARGHDFAAEQAGAELAGYGVEICGPEREGRGGVVVSVADPDGRRTMASDRGAASELGAEDIDPEWLRGGQLLHVSGYCLMREPMAQAAIEAARVARQVGAGSPRVSVDLASAHDIELIGAERFTARLRALAPELAFATEAERAAVPGFDTDWVIKRGPRGASFPEGAYAALPTSVVDATGAGDALAAGYLVGGPELAMEAAALSLGQIGAMPPPHSFGKESRRAS